MFSKSLKVILALYLLTLSYCSAMRRVHPIEHSSSFGKEKSISEAICNGKRYDGHVLRQAANSAKELLDKLEVQNEDLNWLKYNRRFGEVMPFKPPYYYYLLNDDETHDDKGDFVIVTREGQIAKVVYQAKARWSYKFVDCQMLYVRSPTS